MGVITSAFTPSTAPVPPQNRMFDSDIEEYVILHGDGTGESLNWFPGRKIRITSLRLANGLTAQAASTNTTALNIDVEDGAGVFVADVAAKAAGTAVGIDSVLSLTLSTTEADLVMQATEMLKCLVTIAGVQGEFTVSVGFKRLDVIDYPGDWPATP